jgi:hypothetical protein
MSSSNRVAPDYDGVVLREGEPTGPVRLPENRSSDFVAQFNRIYGCLGLSLQPIEREAVVEEVELVDADDGHDES